MDLSPRHRVILKALVEEFVSDNRAVGSKTLSEKYDIGLSPATIRSSLAELEDMGFVVARHTSGGRVPTERGYRFYVDSLVTLFELTIKEKQRIQEEYLKMQFRLDQVLIATSKVLASLSQSASVVLGPEGSLDTLKHIELIHVNGNEVLMILVMRSGTVLNRNIFFDHHISQETLYQISRYMNDNVKGFDVHEVQNNLIPQMMMRKDGPEDFVQLAPSIARAMGAESMVGDNLYIDGLKNLYENFKDEEDHLENILHLFDEKHFLRNFFTEHVPMDGVYTIIGQEGDTKLGGVTIITTNYRMGEKRIGSMGIIGPQRMNYNKTLPLLEFTSKLVSEMITKLSR
ncbi:heat-inducible transcriptional repressor HrcA [Leptospira ilyithenensis]|uniref:Heat-inducible transcription repressor HrcA n=1 Tax=Leptospira ilyithenensis TaxID=2484901 RepID=A0A4R9LP88_9LEPT|nr:heat-inducible transcriptional repressor HrcA [Leptospira ilyithenensis]TGN10895.1 heat-inducible transcription repressor HrcA [Leptospira ilyithenensis]